MWVVRSETRLCRCPLTSYFVLVYALAWGGVLWVVEGMAAIALTALVEGKAGLRAMWARLTRWRVDLRW